MPMNVMTGRKQTQSAAKNKRSAIMVDVQYGCRNRDNPSARTIRHWVRTCLQNQRQRTELTVRIVGRAEGAKLNERWRQQLGPTNVLSFPFGVTPLQPALLGDIVVCAPVVKLEAAQQKKDLSAHWAHMIVHGVLHLLGFDHTRPRDASKMEAQEVRILQNLGYTNPYL